MSKKKRVKPAVPTHSFDAPLTTCYFCAYCDSGRTCGPKVRCTRFSRWVDPNIDKCKEGISRAKQLMDMIDESAKKDLVSPINLNNT